jgi:hypothetical protein
LLLVGQQEQGNQSSRQVRSASEIKNRTDQVSKNHKIQKMETRSSSRFSGVFTLKTQAEANELAQAVTTLVERGVNIFQELEKGTSREIEDTLKAVIRYFYNFFFVCKNVLLAM